MNEDVRKQLMAALKVTAAGRWARSRAVKLELEKHKHRLSVDSVQRYLGQLQKDGVVERDFQEGHVVWRLPG
jgi:hypothetical protein